MLMVVNNTKAMVIAKKASSRRDRCPTLLFVHQFSYLGAQIDDNMTMQHDSKSVYRRVDQKIFMSAKLSYLADKNTSLKYINKQYCHVRITLFCCF